VVRRTGTFIHEYAFDGSYKLRNVEKLASFVACIPTVLSNMKQRTEK